MRQYEMEELQHIYEERGLPTDLAKDVAMHLTKNDAVLAHARDELNIDPDELANPGQVCGGNLRHCAVPYLFYLAHPG